MLLGPGHKRFSLVFPDAERWRSPAAESGSAAHAGGSQLRALVRGLGGYAASHAEGTAPAHAFRAILVGRPWVVVTVPTLVPRARWLGWSRESATTSLVTGPVLIPFGRLHIFPSLPPPTAVVHLWPTLGGEP